MMMLYFWRTISSGLLQSGGFGGVCCWIQFLLLLEPERRLHLEGWWILALGLLSRHLLSSFSICHRFDGLRSRLLLFDFALALTLPQGHTTGLQLKRFRLLWQRWQLLLLLLLLLKSRASSWALIYYRWLSLLNNLYNWGTHWGIYGVLLYLFHIYWCCTGIGYVWLGRSPTFRRFIRDPSVSRLTWRRSQLATSAWPVLWLCLSDLRWHLWLLRYYRLS